MSMKRIEEGAFCAEVDAADLDNVKIKLTMTAPLFFSNYHPSKDPWMWEMDIEEEVKYLRYKVHDYIHEVWREQRRLRQYAD